MASTPGTHLSVEKPVSSCNLTTCEEEIPINFNNTLQPPVSANAHSNIPDENIEECPVKASEDGGNITCESESVRDPKLETCGVQISESTIYENEPRKPSVDELPECLQKLLEGLNVPGDSKCPLDSKPDWLDMKKYKKGQEFAIKNWGCLCFGNMLSLMLGLSFQRFLEPLIFTGKSDTPFKAFKRYLSTVNRVLSWYQGNIWDPNDPAHKDIKAVRFMHNNVMKRMNSMSPEELKSKVTLLSADGCCKGMWCEVNNEVFEEFKDLCPAKISDEYPYNVFTSTGVGTMFMTQFDMAMTQLGFIGSILLYPKEFGIHNATREELEGFIHFWRCVGYLLGVEDRFNVCSGSLEDTLNILRSVSKYWARPSLRELGRDGEHMSRCMVEGIRHYMPRVLYNSMLMYGSWVYDIKTHRSSRLLRLLNWKEWIMFILSRFVFCYYIRVPGVRQSVNWMVKRRIRKANNMSESWLKKKESKVYSYQVDSQCTKL